MVRDLYNVLYKHELTVKKELVTDWLLSPTIYSSHNGFLS